LCLSTILGVRRNSKLGGFELVPQVIWHNEAAMEDTMDGFERKGIRHAMKLQDVTLGVTP